MSPALRTLTLAIFTTAFPPRAGAQPRGAPMRLVGVTVHGPLRVAAVRSGLQRASELLRGCPTQGLQGARSLSVAMLINAEGVVFRRVRVLDAEGVPFATSACVAERLSAVAFPHARVNEVTAVEARWILAAPPPRRRANEISLMTSAGTRAPSAAPPPPPPSPGRLQARNPGAVSSLAE
jgi:hypothetical protein